MNKKGSTIKRENLLPHFWKGIHCNRKEFAHSTIKGASNEYSQHMFLWRNKPNYQYFLVEIITLFGVMTLSWLLISTLHEILWLANVCNMNNMNKVMALGAYKMKIIFEIVIIPIYIQATTSENITSDMCLVKILMRLCICAVSSESSLGTFWIAKDAKFPHADNESSNLTAPLHRQIRVFVRRTCQKEQFLTLLLIYLRSTITAY